MSSANRYRNPSNRGRWTALAVLGVITLVIILQFSGLWRPVSIVLDGILQPVGRFTTNITRSLGGFFQTIGSLNHLSKDNLNLQRELENSRGELSRLKEIENENSLLRSQLGFQKDLPLKLIGANVIAYGPDNVRRTLVINRGSRDGVLTGQAVVSSGSLVGKIERTDANTAVIGLISDPDFRVQALGQTERARGILRGELGTGLKLEQIAQNETVSVGENIITAGSDRIPKGILIGTTESVDKSDNEIFQSANVRSVLNFDKLEIAFVVNQ